MSLRVRGLATLLLVLTILSQTGCARGAAQVVQPPVAGLVGHLEDEVRDLPEGRIIWSTYWVLCWTAYPGVTTYELQPVTGEGASRKLRQQRETCLRVEAAAGENAKAEGLPNRDLLVRLQTGQLAYRVRGVLSGNRVSEWSQLMAVGETGGR